MTNEETTLKLPDPIAALGYVERLLVTGKVSPDMLGWLAGLKQQILTAMGDVDLDHNRVALKEFPDSTPDREIDMMDRIISGLPLGRLYDVASLHPTEVNLDTLTKSGEYHIKSEAVELVDVVSAYPESPHWVAIPNFENYEICRHGDVRSKWTKRVLEFEPSMDGTFVEMHDKQGFPHLVSTDGLVEEIFG